MDLSGIAALIGSVGGLAGIATIWKAAKTAAKNEVLAEQSQETIKEKDKEIERLWRLLDHLTKPEAGP